MNKKTWTKPAPVERVPFKPTYAPSEEQEGIFKAIDSNNEHLHCEASPGSGKSTTIKWTMTLNKVRNAAYLAFSKAIVTEIEPQCPIDCVVKTAHSFGYSSLAGKYGKLFVYNDKVRKILNETYPYLNPDNFHGEKKGPAFALLSSTIDLIEKTRVNLIDEKNPEEIIRIADKYNIDLGEDTERIMSIIPDVYRMIEEKPQSIDFTDMMWLPIRLGLKIPQFDMLYVDERQDLNPLMIEYVFRMTRGRIMTVGDQCQSIFGFSGADTQSTAKLVGRFPGLELPLNTCYRCGTDIVEYAATIYDKIKPFERNHKGEVERREKLDWEMKDGSMILSRRNANLIKPCFELLKKGRKAIIKGRDIGAGLIKLIDQQKATDVMDLVDKIDIYRLNRIDKLMSHKEKMISAIEATNDQCDCIKAIAENCSSVAEVKDRIGMIFSEDTKGVVLSSIHRSKGLEAPHVSIIDYSRVRINNDKMSADDHIQEKNLEFVAVTRAINKLHLIG